MEIWEILGYPSQEAYNQHRTWQLRQSTNRHTIMALAEAARIAHERATGKTSTQVVISLQTLEHPPL